MRKRYRRAGQVEEPEAEDAEKRSVRGRWRKVELKEDVGGRSVDVEETYVQEAKGNRVGDITG